MAPAASETVISVLGGARVRIACTKLSYLLKQYFVRSPKKASNEACQSFGFCNAGSVIPCGLLNN
ncbi:hypothetical protein Hanom_Chr17g01539861 [Helianthus anomalus]